MIPRLRMCPQNSPPRRLSPRGNANGKKCLALPIRASSHAVPPLCSFTRSLSALPLYRSILCHRGDAHSKMRWQNAGKHKKTIKYVIVEIIKCVKYNTEYIIFMVYDWGSGIFMIIFQSLKQQLKWKVQLQLPGSSPVDVWNTVWKFRFAGEPVFAVCSLKTNDLILLFIQH